MTVSHEDIDNRLERGEGRFTAIEKKLDELIGAVTTLTETVEPIRDDISTIKEMTGGWKAIGIAGRFVKWAGGVAAAIVAVLVVIKAGAKALLLP